MTKDAKYYRDIMDKARKNESKNESKRKEVIERNKEKYKDLIEAIEESVQKSAEEGYPFDSFEIWEDENEISEDEGTLTEIKDIIFDLYSSEDGFITTADIEYRHEWFYLIVKITWGDDE